jgi:hypothetical protein
VSLHSPYLTFLAVVAFFSLPSGGHAQEVPHEHGAHEAAGLGSVDFPAGCAAEVQPDFDRAVALLHSFGYAEAHDAFAAVGERDPACGMAHWGIAMSQYHPLWAPPGPEELSAGRAAAERAAALGARGEREQEYIAAIGAFYRDSDTVDHRTRALAYSRAMETLAVAHPEDREATIFFALSLLGTAPADDATHAQQRRAAEILNGLLPSMPQHPGIAHYIIHAFDYPELAELALPAARTYARIAPASPHAQHMPSHIFVRLGLWEEAIASNLDSEASANAIVARRSPGAASFDALHALDYLEYAYLQTGREAEARAVVARAGTARTFDEANFAAAYALAAIPARWALERGDWAAAASLELPRAELPWERFPYAAAPTHFARAVGAARSGDLGAARAALAELAAIEAGLATTSAGPYDWTGQVASMRLAAAGWLAHVEGRSEEGVGLLREAAALEDRVGKHPVTPGAIVPARELLADLLLELERPAEAAAEFRSSLAVAPGRRRALLGAERADEAAG